MVNDNNSLVICSCETSFIETLNIIVFFVIWRKEEKNQHLLDTLYVSDVILGMFTYQTGYIIFISDEEVKLNKLTKLPSATAHKGVKSQSWHFPSANAKLYWSREWVCF